MDDAGGLAATVRGSAGAPLAFHLLAKPTGSEIVASYSASLAAG